MNRFPFAIIEITTRTCVESVTRKLPRNGKKIAFKLFIQATKRKYKVVKEIYGTKERRKNKKYEKRFGAMIQNRIKRISQVKTHINFSPGLLQQWHGVSIQ